MPDSTGQARTIVNLMLQAYGSVRISCKVLKYSHPFRSAITPFTGDNYPLLDVGTEENITEYVIDWKINKSHKLVGSQLTLDVVYDPDDVNAPTFEANDIIIVYERIREERSLQTTGWIRQGIFLVDSYPVAIDEGKWRIVCTDGFKLAGMRHFVGTLEAERIEYERDDSVTLTRIDNTDYYSFVHSIDPSIPYYDRWHNWAAEPPPLLYWRINPGDTWQRLFLTDNVQIILSTGEVRISKAYYEELFGEGDPPVVSNHPIIGITYSRYRNSWEIDKDLWFMTNNARDAFIEVLRDCGFHDESNCFPALFFLPSDGRIRPTLYETQFDSVQEYDGISAYTDYTTEAGDLENTFSLPNAVDKILYLGAVYRFKDLILEMSTAAIGEWVYRFEYWNGTVWHVLTISDNLPPPDYTSSAYVHFDVMGGGGAVAKFTTIDGHGPYYYIRMRCTTAGTTPAVLRRIMISDHVVLPKLKYVETDEKTHLDVLGDIIQFCKPNYVLRMDNDGYAIGYEVVQAASGYDMSFVEEVEAEGSDQGLLTRIVYRGSVIDPIDKALESRGALGTAYYTGNLRENSPKESRRKNADTPIDGSAETYMEWRFINKGTVPAVLDDQHVLWRVDLGAEYTIGEGSKLLVSSGPSSARWTIESSVNGSTWEYLSYDAMDLIIPDGRPTEIEGKDMLPTSIRYIRFRCTQYAIEQDTDTRIGGTRHEIHQLASLRQVTFYDEEIIRKVAEIGTTVPFNTVPYQTIAKRLQHREKIIDVDPFANTDFFIGEKARLYLRFSFREYETYRGRAFRPDAELHDTVNLVIPQKNVDDVFVIEEITKGKGGICDVTFVHYETDIDVSG